LAAVEQDVQEAGVRRRVVVGEVAFDVLDGLCEQVQAISQLVELLAGDDQLVLAEAELGGSPAGLVVALAARAAVTPGTARARRRFVLTSAP